MRRLASISLSSSATPFCVIVYCEAHRIFRRARRWLRFSFRIGAVRGRQPCRRASITLSLSEEEADAELAQLTDIGPPPRSMVLGKNDDLNKVLLALSQGANGYISISSGFDIFVQALRFVGAGGTYVPAQCLLEAKQAPAAASEQASRRQRIHEPRARGDPGDPKGQAQQSDRL